MIVRYGAVVAQASGSIGSTTAANRRGSQIIRQRGRRTQPQTDAQLEARLVFAQALSEYRQLSAGAKLAWDIYALRNPRANRLGVFRRLTGRQFYMKQAIPMIAGGIGAPGTPPGLGQQGIGTPWEVTFTEGGPYTIAFATPTADPHGYYILAGHRPMSTTGYGRPFWRVVQTHYVEDSDSWSCYTEWTAIFGDMIADELFMITLRYQGLNSLCSAAATWRSVVGSP